MTNRKALILLAAFGAGSGIIGLNVFKQTEVKKEKSIEVAKAPAVETPVVETPTPTARPIQLYPAIKQTGMVQQVRNVVELADLINAERLKKGLRVLRTTTTLSDAAQVHAEYLLSEQKCSHKGKGDLFPWQRAKADGEVVGCGYSTAKEILTAWLTSRANRDFVLHPDAKRLGVGYSGQYWVVMFGF